MRLSRPVKHPHFFWTMTEWRALFELSSFCALRLALKRLPKGDGHPVLVIPGFLASDHSTRPMRCLLKDLGYDARGWGLGRNVRVTSEREGKMSEVVEALNAKHDRRVSIIGWSLGGVFARELAKLHGDKIRSVITLGSPITNERGHSRPTILFEAINGSQAATERDGRYTRLQEPPQVPTTSILSKADGIVAWRGSVQRPNAGETENICLPASHTGIGFNPLTMIAIADRLAQPENDWRPFDHDGWRNLFFSGVDVKEL